MRQSAVTDADVVDRGSKAKIPDIMNELCRGIEVVQLVALGDLQNDLAGRYSCRRHDPPKRFDEFVGQKVARHDVQRQLGFLVLPQQRTELLELQAPLGDITARGASLVAISPQIAANGRKSQRDNKLSFPILSDVKSEVANVFGIRFALPDYLVETYKSFGNNLPVINDDPSWVLPMPARYVIGSDGIIAYSEVNPDYTHRPDLSELLPVLDRLRVEKAA